MNQAAFTIVELLIVITVIGILATISVVAYNGVQDRARTASAVDGANQAADLLEAFALKNNGLYPATGSLASAGVADSTSVTYQYSQVSGGANYCLTATSGNISYMMTQDAKPVAGGCAGHGVNGNAPITNLSTNPRATLTGAGWFSNNGAIYPVTKGVAISGHPASIVTAAKSQLVTGQVSGCLLSIYSADTLANSAIQRTVGLWVMTTGTGYQARVYAASTPVVWTPLSANTWTFLKMSTGSTGYVSVSICKVSGNALEADIGYATGSIAVAGTNSYNFADGYTSGWIWNGTVNNSTSTGSPQ
jgi:prepilin-type N-terminal cleavage/methylation domain-containing protein